MSHKFTWLGLFSTLLTITSMAQTVGDTTTISSHNNTHLDWYGRFNEETVFPTTGNYKKIIMEYNLGCPTAGCSDWDYTTQINVLNPTGVIDSTLKQAPGFTVDGAQIDTFYYSNSQTFYTEFNSTTLMTDSINNDTLTVVVFGDTLNPLTPTDTIFVFDANYTVNTFDTLGVAIDTTFINATDTMYLEKTGYYKYFEVIETIELGRAITPYGGNLNDPWNRKFTFDVTEFEPFLKDTMTIQANYSGWSDGFTAHVDFHFINGTPTREVKEFTPLWHGAPKYGEQIDGVHTIENFVSEKTYSMAGATFAELTFTPTGHGFGDAENCAEFCQKNFNVISNGSNVGQQLIWKDDCGENALFPQPGTWLYDRANWCPGEQVNKYNFDLTPSTTAGENTVDVEFQNYTSESGGSYIVDGYVVTYGDFNFNNNVEISKILAPSTEFDNKRFNPICGNPIFEFKNLSGQNVTSVNFSYGIEGVSLHYYNWTGNLSPLATEQVELPTLNAFDFAQTSSSTFFVKAHNVNGSTDEDLTDNEMKSSFETVKDFPADFRVILKTNNFGNQNSWTIKDMDGNVMASQSNPASNQTLETNVNLDQGCYKFELLDTQKNGLNFWAASAEGSGSIRIRKLGSNATLKSFGSDFGSKIEYYFTVGTPLSTSEFEEELTLNISPNPNSGIFQVELPTSEEFTHIIIYDNAGRAVKTVDVNQDIMQINCETLSSGLYIIEAKGNSKSIKETIIIAE